MRTFILTSDRFAGEVELKFNDQDRFIAIDFVNATISVQQQGWLLKKLPVDVAGMGLYKQYKDIITVTEVSAEVTFEVFWIKYDDKLNSSKKKTEAKWNKMSLKERKLAFAFIPKYFINIPSGTRKKYAETYLNSELWNN